MKTIPFLVGLLLCCVTSLWAQPASTNPAVEPPNLPRRNPRIAVDGPPLPGITATAATNAVAGGVTAPKPAITEGAPATVSASPAAIPAIPAPPMPTPRPITPRRMNPGASNVVASRLVADPAKPAAPPTIPIPPLPTPGNLPTTPGATAGTGTPAPGAGTAASGTNIAAAAAGLDILPPGLIKFQDADLLQVLDLYQELTGRTVIRPSSLPAGKISIRTQTSLTRQEAIHALDSILSLNGVVMAPQGEKFVKAVIEAQMGNTGQIFNYDDPNKLPESGTPVWQIVHVTNAVPGEVAKALTPFAKSPSSLLAIDSANVLIIRDYAENVKRMMDIISKIDVVPVDEIKNVVIPIKYALAGDIAQVLTSLTSGGGGATTVGRQQSNTGLTGAGGGGFGSGMRGGGMGSGYGGGGMGYQGSSGMPGTAGYNQSGSMSGAGGLGSSSGGGRSSFANRLNQIVNRAASGDIVVLGQTKIIADERTNSLLIFASRQDLTQISNIIQQLDVVLSQVLIEALIFEVSLNDSLDYGISYLQNSPSTSGKFTGIGAINNKTFLNEKNFQNIGSNGLAGLPGGFSYFAKFGDLDVAAKAVATDARINVLSRPRIQTSHAVEANLFVGRTRPYPTGTSYGGYGYGGNYSQIQQLQIGITLSVLPLVNPDGLVVMDIRQRTQSIGADIEIQGVGSVPETIDREANAKVAVKDRETIVLGGFISTSKNKSATGVPFLKDIPILGNLFRSTSKSSDRQELMILIRPTVLPNPSDAASLVAEEKRHMPGVRKAEKELMEDNVPANKAEVKSLYMREGFSQ